MKGFGEIGRGVVEPLVCRERDRSSGLPVGAYRPTPDFAPKALDHALPPPDQPLDSFGSRPRVAGADHDAVVRDGVLGVLIVGPAKVQPVSADALAEALSQQSVTDLRQHIAVLGQHSESGEKLAAYLLDLAGRFDLAGIRAVLDDVGREEPV